jgi:hypothetical protein
MPRLRVKAARTLIQTVAVDHGTTSKKMEWVQIFQGDKNHREIC